VESSQARVQALEEESKKREERLNELERRTGPVTVSEVSVASFFLLLGPNIDLCQELTYLRQRLEQAERDAETERQKAEQYANNPCEITAYVCVLTFNRLAAALRGAEQGVIELGQELGKQKEKQRELEDALEEERKKGQRDSEEQLGSERQARQASEQEKEELQRRLQEAEEEVQQWRSRATEIGDGLKVCENPCIVMLMMVLLTRLQYFEEQVSALSVRIPQLEADLAASCARADALQSELERERKERAEDLSRLSEEKERLSASVSTLETELARLQALLRNEVHKSEQLSAVRV
jgi:DNA repair exonuclease SbcCD ATPase subunit